MKCPRCSRRMVQNKCRPCGLAVVPLARGGISKDMQGFYGNGASDKVCIDAEPRQNGEGDTP